MQLSIAFPFSPALNAALEVNVSGANLVKQHLAQELQRMLPLHVRLASADRCAKADRVWRDPVMQHLAQEIQCNFPLHSRSRKR